MIRLIALALCFILSLLPHAFQSYVPSLVLINLLLLTTLLFLPFSPSQKPGISLVQVAPIQSLLLLTLWYGLSVYWSQAIVSTQTLFYAINILLLGAIVATTLQPRAWEWMKILLLITGLLLVATSLYQTIFTAASFSHPLFIGKNNYAGFLNLLLLPVAAALLATPTKKHAYLLGLLLCLIAMNLSISQSRGAFIGLIAGIAALGYLSKPWRQRSLLVVIGWTTLGITLAWLTQHGGLETKLITTVSEIATDHSTPINPRFAIWNAALEMYQQHPLLGWGGGTFKIAYPAFRPAEFSPEIYNAHNDYLQILVELGPIGVLLLIITIAMTLITGLRASRANQPAAEAKAGMTAGLLALFIQMFFTSSLYATPIALVAGMYIGRITTVCSGGTDTAYPLPRLFIILAKGFIALLIVHLVSIAISERYIRESQTASSVEQRIALLDTASRLRPTNDAPHYYKAKLVADLLGQGDSVNSASLEHALHELDVAQKLMPLRRQIYWQRARLLQYQKPIPYGEIEHNYLSALRLNPKFLRARVELAHFLEQQGKVQQACHILKQGLKERYYTRRTTLLRFAYQLQSCLVEKRISESSVPNIDANITYLQSHPNDIIFFQFPTSP